MNPLCLDFLTAIEASPPELAALAAANGCGLISFLVHPVEGVPDFGMAADTPTRRETRRRCRDLDVAIDMIEGFLLKPDTNIVDFRPSLESGAWLGARSVNVLLRDDDVGRLADRFAEFCDEAAAFELEIVTEWSRRTPLKTLTEAALFLARVKRPAARLQIDSLHLFRGGFMPADLAQLEPGLVGRAQLSDGPADMPVDRQFAEAIGERCIPGEGELPLLAFLDVLPAGITIGLEVPMTSLRDQGIGPEERVRRVVDASRQLVERRSRTGI